MSDASNVDRDQISERDRELYCRMQQTIYGMEDIFWALNVLTDSGVDILRPEKDLKNSIAYLMVASEQLANAVSEQF